MKFVEAFTRDSIILIFDILFRIVKFVKAFTRDSIILIFDILFRIADAYEDWYYDWIDKK